MHRSGALADVSLHDMCWVLWFAFAAAVFMLVVLGFAASLCKAFWHCRSPFEENVITKIRHLAFSLIPCAVFSSVRPSAGGDVDFTLDAGVVITVLIIFALAYVFKYGAMLQQESDETL